MAEFNSVRDAKEYLVGKIAAEAELEGKPLSEIERKMLYFSETGCTLPDIGKSTRHSSAIMTKARMKKRLPDWRVQSNLD
jgi:hypothetical protein